jgi:hypothetical protein
VEENTWCFLPLQWEVIPTSVMDSMFMYFSPKFIYWSLTI